jgi:DNA polymerase-1
MMDPLLIIDCNNFCHRAWHTTGQLSHKGTPTGVIFGFFEQLFTVVKAVRPGECVFVWDSLQSRRKARHPFYKQRPPGEDMTIAFQQFDLLRAELLPQLGFVNVLRATGFEADDIIAQLSIDVVQSHPKQSVVIASADEDLFQLLSPQVSIFKYKTKSFISEKNFASTYGVFPDSWAEVKAIAGCTSDKIPGIVGVGQATAIKYLRGELPPASKKYKAIQDGQDIIERNRWLVTLPLPGTPRFAVQPSAFDAKQYQTMCRRFGFSGGRGMVDDLEVFFT